MSPQKSCCVGSLADDRDPMEEPLIIPLCHARFAHRIVIGWPVSVAAETLVHPPLSSRLLARSVPQCCSSSRSISPSLQVPFLFLLHRPPSPASPFPPSSSPVLLCQRRHSLPLLPSPAPRSPSPFAASVPPLTPFSLCFQSSSSPSSTVLLLQRRIESQMPITR